MDQTGQGISSMSAYAATGNLIAMSSRIVLLITSLRKNTLVGTGLPLQNKSGVFAEMQ